MQGQTHSNVVTQELECLINGRICIKSRGLEAETVLHHCMKALTQALCLVLVPQLLSLCFKSVLLQLLVLPAPKMQSMTML